ncbi:MAG: glycosyltransferase family 4 protein [Actinomycetota bacterium]
MRVAHLTTMDLALRYLLLPQLEAVLDAGGDAVGISGRSDCVEELERAGVRHLELKSSTRGSNLFADIRSARELWKILRREKVDVLHTHNPKPGLYGRVLGRLAGVPIVINTVHGLYATEDDSLVKRVLVYGLEGFASRFSDAELVQSAEDLALINRLHLAPQGRSRLLGNGIDVRRFDPQGVTADEGRKVRASIGIPEDKIVVGMVGRLVAEKGYPELFEAASLLDDRFVILTSGHADPQKRDALPPSDIERARSRGVLFLGMRPDMERVYRAMDIFVLPSHREGVPRAAMEAAAMGLPIVATNIRGCREVVSDGANGLLVPVGDAPALAKAIRKLGDDASLRGAMGKAGRQVARRRFDERQVVQIVLETYAQVASRKGLAWEGKPVSASGTETAEGTAP